MTQDHSAGYPPSHLYNRVHVCAHSCPTVCEPMNYSLLGSSVHGIFQARILEQVVNSFSRGSSWPKDWTPCLLSLLHWQTGSLLLFHLGLSPEGLFRHRFPWFCENPYSPLVNIKKKILPFCVVKWEINSRPHIIISSWLILLSFPSSLELLASCSTTETYWGSNLQWPFVLKAVLGFIFNDYFLLKSGGHFDISLIERSKNCQS